MLQAYMILPAFLLFYLIAANTTIKKKIVSLVSALAVLATVSLSWPLIVDNIPASKRPYIGSARPTLFWNWLSDITGFSG